MNYLKARQVPLYIFILLTVGCALLLRIYFSYISLENLPLTSDEASSALLAQMIHDGARPFLFIGQPYQFPVESYLFSVISSYAPANPYGIRLFIILLGIITTLALLYCVWLGYKQGERWLPLLLVLFPSYYVFENLFAYTAPQYGIGRLLSVIAIALILAFRKHRRPWLLGCCGIASGLAVSNHLLYVSPVVGIAAMVFFQGSIRSVARDLIIFSAGLLLGLLPLLYALYFIPGAYGNLPAAIPFYKLPQRIFDVFSNTLPIALGSDALLFHDFPTSLGNHLWLQYPFGYGFLVLLSIALYFRGRRFLASMTQRQWPRLELIDLAIITTLVTFILLIRSSTISYHCRYLLPALWILPFWVVSISALNRYVRNIIIVSLILLLFFNVHVTWSIIDKWKDKDMLQKVADTPDISTLIRDLKEQNMDRCYASFWLAYRITYETNGEIVCAMPFNERFLNWPIPYNQQIDLAENAVYVLTQTPLSRLRTLSFEGHLKEQGFSYQRLKSRYRMGSFDIFHSFTKPEVQEEVHIPESAWTQTMQKNEKAVVSDQQNLDSQTGEGVTIFLNLEQKVAISSLIFWFQPPFSRDIIGKVQILDQEKGWINVSGQTRMTPDRLHFVNKHPIYGEFQKKITFKTPQYSDQIRVDLASLNGFRPFKKIEILAEKRGNPGQETPL